ncbi:MAG: ASKHA domain-containing protein [Bacteroidales bacterium]|nr:ASKHA domain-containing protein [Lachnoclostridium sp.]MCM1383284.1 ASKHA domain-containing protein [Lachnoclostridium sp.]MCM1465772.1 ASKHA domain-containing protein [Bacteroidales bacterium]
MIKREISSDSGNIGNRCDICIGCGRCRTKNPFSVTVDSGLTEEVFPLSNHDGRRLVTVDIGTTTIAMQLYGRDGKVDAVHAVVNPQTEYGADVLSRIQAAEDAGTAAKLQDMVQDVLEQGFSDFKGRLSENESLFGVIAANTPMVYLLMGYDAGELGRAPFSVSHPSGINADIRGVSCVIFPCLSAFVGGDIVAGIYASGMTEAEKPVLLIDLGTNGEIVLGSKDKILACATAAGPAFEGGANRGIWGADMVSLIARIKREHIVDETGLLSDAYFESGVNIGDVSVSQKSIRQIQLAKGAIAAGIRILAKEYGIGYSEISKVVLAGGFGYYLNPQDAAEIGLLPEELVKKSVAGGNTALAGALLLGREILAETWGEAVTKAATGEAFLKCRTKIINLAEHPDFQENYLEEMNL